MKNHSLVAEDVTDQPEKLRQARMLVAENYAPLSSTKQDVQEVYGELCEDEYQRRGYANTILVHGIHPLTGKKCEALGTLRVVLGHGHCDIDALEIMSLMHPHGGWSQFQFDNFNADRSAELCRFAVSPDARKLGLVELITNFLFDKAMYVACKRGCTQFWAIMPRYVTLVVRQAGFDLHEAKGLSLDHSRHGDLFGKYDRYWLRNKPSLFRVRSLSESAS